MSTSSLQRLFAAINQSQDEATLRSQIVPQIGAYFGAKRSGIFFFNSLQEVLRQLPFADRRLQKTLQMGFSVEHNPVLRYLVEHHAPVHEALVTSPKVWQIICPRADHWHVMAGPIVSQGQLIGAVGCTREKAMPAFDTQNLADLSAVCLHLSVWTATVRSGHSSERKSQSFTTFYSNGKADRLTPRELEIAALVALGRTNAEIGHELWITENSVKQALKRMFRKLQVSSRTEMVAQLVK